MAASKFTLTGLMLFCTVAAKAQSPVINRANYFDIGDSALAYFKYDTSLWIISPGVSGMNATWDFSEMDFNHSSVLVDTLLFISPVGTPFYPTNLSADYSQANLCMLRKTEPFSPENNDYNYYKATDDSLAFIGHWAATGGTELWEDHCDDFIRELVFPLAYPYVYMDSFTRSFNDLSGSGMHFQTGSYVVSADGYGTMVTPDGATLSNALRLHIVKTVRDSSSLGVDNYTLHSYSWYASGVKGFVLTLNMAFGDSTSVETAFYQKQTNTTTGVNGNITYDQTLQLYPNPAVDEVTLHTNGIDRIETVRLINAICQVVREDDVLNPHNFTLDTNDLTPGVYMLSATTVGGKIFHERLIVVR